MNATVTAPAKSRILLIDDSPEIHEDYRKILAADGAVAPLDAVDAFLGESPAASHAESESFVELDSAFQGEEGLRKVKEAIAEGRPYKMAFVDMRMPPGWDGLQTIEALWEVSPDLQVVICTAHSDATWHDIVKRFGRSDKLLILKKPFDQIEVSQLAVALTEKWSLTRKARLKQADLERLVEERTQELKRAAMHDPLTDLPNRKMFMNRLKQAFAEYHRKGTGSSVILLDLDRFKEVNDTLGHPAGDELLNQVARRLKDVVRASDTVARLGGDEFAIIRTEVKNQLSSNLAIERIQSCLKQPYDIGNEQMACGVSMGVAMIPDDGNTADEILKRADLALYRAKAHGRGRYCVFDQAMDSEIERIRQLERELRVALEGDQFELHYQPIVDAHTHRLHLYEALIRWRHPQQGLVPPGQFLSILERTELIVPIGRWIIQQACRDAAAWPEEVGVSINVSAAQLKRDNRFEETVVEALADTKMKATRVELEVTESVAFGEDSKFLPSLHRLRERGVRFALDDFGTGHSALSYLRQFPFDVLKLDRSFLSDGPQSKESAAILRAVAGLGKSLGMQTTAEGVETKEQAVWVANEGYSHVQGYYFAKPKPTHELQPESSLVTP